MAAANQSSSPLLSRGSSNSGSASAGLGADAVPWRAAMTHPSSSDKLPINRDSLEELRPPHKRRVRCKRLRARSAADWCRNRHNLDSWAMHRNTHDATTRRLASAHVQRSPMARNCMLYCAAALPLATLATCKTCLNNALFSCVVWRAGVL